MLQEGDDKPGVMEQLRMEVCECASLYALKYEEEFAPHASAFVAAVWHLLLDTTHAAKYDAVSINATPAACDAVNLYMYKYDAVTTNLLTALYDAFNINMTQKL